MEEKKENWMKEVQRAGGRGREVDIGGGYKIERKMEGKEGKREKEGCWENWVEGQGT